MRDIKTLALVTGVYSFASPSRDGVKKNKQENKKDSCKAFCIIYKRNKKLDLISISLLGIATAMQIKCKQYKQNNSIIIMALITTMFNVLMISLSCFRE